MPSVPFVNFHFQVRPVPKLPKLPKPGRIPTLNSEGLIHPLREVRPFIRYPTLNVGYATRQEIVGPGFLITLPVPATWIAMGSHVPTRFCERSTR